jgi:hypothetical protein
MATGAGLGGLVALLLPLVGIVTVLKARSARKRGPAAVDEEFETRQAANRETERRLAAYLASRDQR